MSNITIKEALQKSMQATKTYVDKQIEDLQLDYVTDDELTAKGYATEDYVNQEIQTIELTPGPQGDKGDKGDTGDNKVGYATCSTAADVAEKVLTIADTNWTLEVGSMITVEHEATNTASNVTLNVNDTGAYPIMYNSSEYTSTSSVYCGHATRPITYLFNGTHWVWLNIGYYPTIPTNPSLGHGYGTCSTAEETLAKACSISSYTLTTGGSVSIKFTNAVPANSTLNIRTRGAKAIYYRGEPITDGIIKAGDTATFVYSTYYHLVSIDRDETFSGDYNDLTNTPTIPTVTNDLTNDLKAEYDAAYAHSQEAHAPADAQKNSDITKAEIEAKLTGTITSHDHSGTYAAESHTHDDRYYTESEINTKVSTLEDAISTAQSAAQTYADNKITALVDSAPDAMNTLNELATAINDHQDVYDEGCSPWS